MKTKPILLLVIALFVSGCGSQTATPTSYPTREPENSTDTFTARINVGTVDVIRQDTIYAGSIHIRWEADAQGNVTETTDYASPICYMTPGKVCQTQGANELLVNGVTLSVESGCWTAKRVGDNYAQPIACYAPQSAITKRLLKPDIQANQYRLYFPSIISSGLECSLEFIEWVWTQPVSYSLQQEVLNCYHLLYPFNSETGTYTDKDGNPAPPLCPPPPPNPWREIFNSSNCA